MLAAIVIACAFAMALPAYSLAVGGRNAEISSAQGVAVLAMRQGQLALPVHLGRNASFRVFGIRDWLQMCWIYAQRISAQVVELCAFGDRAYEGFVGVAVCSDLLRSSVLRHAETAVGPFARALVAVGVGLCSRPVPAPREALSLNFRPESGVVISDDPLGLRRASFTEVKPAVVMQPTPAPFYRLSVAADYLTGIHADSIPGYTS